MRTLGEWKNPKGHAAVHALDESVILIEMDGSLDAEMGARIATTLKNGLAGRAHVHTFWDLANLTAYHSDVRMLNVGVLLDHKSQVASIHAFSKSKLVRMGILAAKIALGGRLQIHDTRTSFDAAQHGVLSTETG